MDNKFIKLMMMTTSNSDQECLTAIRKANRILEAAKVSWADMLAALDDNAKAAPPPKQPPKVDPETWQDVNATDQQRKQRYTNPNIDDMFTILFNRDLSPDFEEFVMSVHLWWKDKKFLTEKQYKAIKRAVERD